MEEKNEKKKKGRKWKEKMKQNIGKKLIKMFR